MILGSKAGNQAWLLSSLAIEESSSTLACLTFWSGKIFVEGGHLMYCRMFSNRPGFQPLDASSILHPSCDNKNVSKYCQISPGGQHCSQWTNHCFRQYILAIDTALYSGCYRSLGEKAYSVRAQFCQCALDGS